MTYNYFRRNFNFYLTGTHAYGKLTLFKRKTTFMTEEKKRELEDALDAFILELELDEDDEQETKKKRVAKRKQVKRWSGITTPKKWNRKAAVKDDSFLAEVNEA